MQELNIEKIDLFKIDVEGAELEILKGSKETLERGTRLIIEPFHLDIIQRYLKSLNYKIEIIDERNLWAYRE